MSQTVARTGCPCATLSPYTSQSVAGQRPAAAARYRAPSAAAIARHRAGLGDAGQVALDVAHEDRHAARLKLSASICSVTVFPVPVAPVISPWRLAIAGSRKSQCRRASASMDSAMGHSASRLPARVQSMRAPHKIAR